MGSYSPGDTAQQVDATSRHPDLWGMFGPVHNGKFDQNAANFQGLERDVPRAAALARVVQHEIIPRLLLVNSEASERAAATKKSPELFDGSDVEGFVKLLLGVTERPAFDALETWQHRGTPIETLFLGLLAPAARLLGDLWTEDLCDFTEVTVALGRLQRMLNRLGHETERQSQHVDGGLSILLAPAPGEQHMLGMAMVGELFRRAGWEVCGGPKTTTADAVALVKKRRFDAIGFSMAHEGHLDALGQSILSVRRAAGPSPQCIVVGGPVFAVHPEYGSKVQADLVATNGKEAPDLVRQFVLANRVCG